MRCKWPSFTDMAEAGIGWFLSRAEKRYFETGETSTAPCCAAMPINTFRRHWTMSGWTLPTCVPPRIPTSMRALDDWLTWIARP